LKSGIFLPTGSPKSVISYPSQVYQWHVIAQGTDGSEICVSESATFDKSPYNPPKNSGSNEDNGNDEGNAGGSGGDSGCTGFGCGSSGED
jgi:hypothetical protein